MANENTDIIDRTFKYLSKKTVNIDIITEEFEKKGYQINVKKNNHGPSSFEVEIEGKLYYPLEKPLKYHKNKSYSVAKMQRRILEFSIPIPLFVGEGNIDKSISEIKKDINPKIKINEWLYHIFTIETATIFYNKYFKQSESLKEYSVIIFESIEAFYAGLDHIAIMSLVPVLEAGLRNIQNSILEQNHKTIKRDDFLKRLRKIIITHGRKRAEQYSWYPGKNCNSDEELEFFIYFNPQCDVIYSFHIYLEQILYKPDYSGSTDFNRNNIVHLFQNNYKEPTNFIRIFLALTHITFIESLTNMDIPFFFPGIDDYDIEIAKYIRELSESFDKRRPLLKQLNICEYN